MSINSSKTNVYLLLVYPLPDPVERNTVTEQVIQSLISLVRTGQLKPGDKLPSEQQLMAQLHVGRTSLRDALRTLSMIGLLEPRRGSGTYVTQSFSGHLADQLEWSAVLGETDLFELLEKRRPLEIQAASLAALRASEQDLLQLHEALAAFEARDKNDEECRIEADLKYHSELAKASGNKVLYRMMFSLGTLIRRFLHEQLFNSQIQPPRSILLFSMASWSKTLLWRLRPCKTTLTLATRNFWLFFTNLIVIRNRIRDREVPTDF